MREPKLDCGDFERRPLDTSASLRQQPSPAIGPALVACLGLSQLVGWGTMHYLVAVFAPAIAGETGWSLAFIHSGFSVALLVMGAASYRVGAWIDRHGGRLAMMAGCWCGVAGCLLLAVMRNQALYIAAWVLLGLGMRLALYDAAFAALAHVGGTRARQAMSLITLAGGLASTVFWPVGQELATAFGWRGALACYALLLAAASLLHLAIPRASSRTANLEGPATGVPAGRAEVRGARGLFAVIAVGIVVLQTAMAAHFIELLRGRGWDPAAAVALASLLGVGQFVGRLLVVLFGSHVDPIRLNLLPGVLQLACFASYLAAADAAWGAAAFAFLYGAGNGIATITRGAMPLVLFDPARYGRTVGAILKPALVLAALAPVFTAWSLQAWGHRATVLALLALVAVVLAASLVLVVRTRRR